MFKIIWTQRASEELTKIEPHISKRILIKVRDLSENTFSREVKKLKGVDAFRLRVGDYRVIFQIEREIISILKVGHRKNIYEK
jgi:mRNA interferase RelE/StbE